jgi:hypothetical protein
MNAIRATRLRARRARQRLAGLAGREQPEIRRVQAGKTALTVPLVLSLAHSGRPVGNKEFKSSIGRAARSGGRSASRRSQ